MNRLILLLRSTNSDLVFLKKLIDIDSSLAKQDKELSADLLFKYILDAYFAVRNIEEESFELLFDENILRHCLMGVRADSYPSPLLIASFFNDFTDYQLADDYTDNVVTIAGIKYNNCILGTLLYSDKSVCCVVNHDALCEGLYFHVINAPELSDSDFDIVNCKGKELHNWFITKRCPQRVYDFGYDKHPARAREYDAPYISSQHYSDKEIESFLLKAVGLKGDRRRYYKISDSEIAVFCNENIKIAPTFHGYVVQTTNTIEMQKIKKGGLYEKIDELR